MTFGGWQLPTNNPFGQDHVQGPGQSHEEIADKKAWCAECHSQGQQDKRLRTGPLAERVGAHHPSSVLGDTTLQHRANRHHDCEHPQETFEAFAVTISRCADS